MTVATLITDPSSYIFFGILHCIALSSVLALPFVRVLPGCGVGARRARSSWRRRT